jgi:hypothetical protein
MFDRMNGDFNETAVYTYENVLQYRNQFHPFYAEKTQASYNPPSWLSANCGKQQLNHSYQLRSSILGHVSGVNGENCSVCKMWCIYQFQPIDFECGLPL